MGAFADVPRVCAVPLVSYANSRMIVTWKETLFLVSLPDGL